MPLSIPSPPVSSHTHSPCVTHPPLTTLPRPHPADLEFIGPKSDSIRLMGDKSTARDTMKARSSHCIALRLPSYPTVLA